MSLFLFLRVFAETWIVERVDLFLKKKKKKWVGVEVVEMSKSMAWKFSGSLGELNVSPSLFLESILLQDNV